ncbi:MAG: DMT family transporter [Rhodospirillaceae bacterium]|nr:DMT family transporter [Rhodospirillaceae bacterium]
MAAILFALTAAFMFALGTQFSKRGLETSDAATGVVIQLSVQAGLYWLMSPFFIEAHFWLMPVVFLFAAMGFFRPFLSSRLAMTGNRHLGPTITSSLSGTSPLFGVLLGIVVLGEELTPALLVGAVAVFSGISLLSWRRGNVKRDWPLWVIFLPICAAFLRAATNLLAKVGMEVLASPYFASLVAASVATIIAWMTSGRHFKVDVARGPAGKWFVLTGICYGTGALSLNLALIRGQLVEISLILACVPIFSLFLGAFVFHEKAITRHVVMAIVLIVAGVMAISLNR